TAGSRLIRIDAATPTVSITRPAGGSSFVHGTRVTITATATDRGTGTGTPSGIASVTFYRGGTQIVTDTLSPYSITWNTTGLAAGTYNLTAVATDVAGNVTTSATVTIRLT
ncbi:MAG TPA: Ig-like domain-containing protein, partial [Actinomycetota bacterium]|nr:Ig-like domain-containing protein [Actinomycetota bacterium]